MPTTVHIPAPLLDAVDRRARALQVSRNRLIVRAIAREVSEPAGWSPEFVSRLRAVDADTGAAVDDLVAAVIRARRSKAPPEL
jgi:hypothetical protein